MMRFRDILEVESGVFASWVVGGEAGEGIKGFLQIPGLRLGGWWCQLRVEKTGARGVGN